MRLLCAPIVRIDAEINLERPAIEPRSMTESRERGSLPNPSPNWLPRQVSAHRLPLMIPAFPATDGNG